MKHYTVSQMANIANLDRSVFYRRVLSMGITSLFIIGKVNYYREETIQEVVEGRLQKKDVILPSSMNF